MDNRRFGADCSAFAARYEAQKLAFGPVVFQCVRIAWKKGLLAALADGALASNELMVRHGLSAYAVDVLLESCLSAGVVARKNGLWELEKPGYMLVNDRLTQINFDWVQDVCWQGLFDLERALDEEKPVGLRHLGDWPSIYEGLSVLPEPARSSWFAFDHYYSDSAFPDALPFLLKRQPRRLMDVGANTGKFARLCLEHDPAVQLTLVDLPIQLDVAWRGLQEAGLAERLMLAPRNLLDAALQLPSGHDVIWMSQFLSCFSLDAIRHILACAARALDEGGRLFILDTFWDRQQFDIASYCLINTSPYFTAIASGNSKIYRADEYIACASDAGLECLAIHDQLGLSHSLLEFGLRP
ncbi:class I SAM-dependent methyltransferase [Chitinilyticum piscinae]|uniref:Class I SAM-dependent methyltransferase n=1 Tax=Chitinilyticum piscinae TaxID=2866724 RepID=A0A8J7FJ42_9NEIS|nr:class I SAM-dependent methyltransferase [Chitinilyticum piscinae]MBE9607829.1 class I SAM-dependent methyltransferase [Chitinilyticum piscinae]